MTRSFPAFAALLGVSLAVACSQSGQQQQGTLAGNDAPQTPFPTAPPLINMNQSPPRSCATTAPGQAITIVDAHTGLPISIGSNEQIIAWQPFWFNASDAFQWTVKNVSTGSTRVVYPLVPIIVGKISMGSHDEGTIAILPFGTSAQKTLVTDYISHIKFTDKVAAESRASKINGTKMPTPTPQESASEAYYFKYESSLVQANALGAAPDDTDYLNAPGNPDSQSPHNYDFVCRYMDDTQYALIWNRETRILQVNNAYTAVQATLAANAAPSNAVQSVGWVPDKYITYEAVPVTPLPVARVNLDSPSPGWDATVAQPYPFQQIDFIDLSPVPTPTPAPMPTP
jgi:hypothetical protein